MKNGFLKNKVAMMALVLSLSILIACNKNVDDPVPNTVVAPTGKTIGQLLGENSDYSLLAALVEKAGLKNAVLDSSKSFTVFAPNNNAIKQAVSILSGGQLSTNDPDAKFLGFFSIADANTSLLLSRVVNYHVIPGLKIKAGALSDTFPNIQLPTNFIIPEPNTNPLVRFSIFVARRQNAAWVNNIPVTLPDLAVASNGVIHGIPAVLLPPNQLMGDAIKNDPELSYLRAAVARADSGLDVKKSPSFQYALSEPLASITVFAPKDDAFRTILTTLIKQALMKQGADEPTASLTASFFAATPDVFSNQALYPVLSANVVRALVAYHILGKRCFANNFPTTPDLFKTLLNLNSLTAAHPGVSVSSSFTGPFATGLKVKGTLNPSDASAAPTATGAVENHTVNGVYYKIDQVLIPFLP
ncbi:MAG: fasciclin domain-containing protein [Bacteroidetes bacterium]|nr:fasciclin domain-containing protein [Bacteroidota bacterium]